MKSNRLWALPLLGALALGACDMDLTDPNNPSEDLAVTTAEGLRQVAVGLQASYTNQVVDPVYTVGLVTDEIGAIPETFESFQKADAGLPIDGTEGPSTGTWFGMYSVIRTADVVIGSADDVGLSPGYTSGMLALGKFYKGLALGQLYQIYPGAPVDVGPTIPNPEFESRETVIAAALDLLNEARGHLQSTPVPSEFYTQVIAPGFDLDNSIDAMIARFALMAEQYDEALAAAQRVDPRAFSEFRAGALDANPLWTMWYASGNAYALRAEEAFWAGADPDDGRTGYWVEEAEIVNTAGDPLPLDHIARYMERSASYPVYFPDEMKLIRAEVHARRGDTDTALGLLNQVRTQCDSPHDEPVACLPALTAEDVPSQDALLDAILEERGFELYLQAVRWSDLRRFNQPTKYPFMPIPVAECDRNTNAPPALCG